MERTMPISGTNSCSDNAPPKMTRTSFPGHTVTKGYYRMFVDNRTMKNIVGGMRTVFIHRKRNGSGFTTRSLLQDLPNYLKACLTR